MLSKDAPYPMVKNGLLHSPPSFLETSNLFDYIELCVNSHFGKSRFQLSTKIKTIIQHLLNEVGYAF